MLKARAVHSHWGALGWDDCGPGVIHLRAVAALALSICACCNPPAHGADDWPAATIEQRSGSVADGQRGRISSVAIPSTGDVKAGSIPAGPANTTAAQVPVPAKDQAQAIERINMMCHGEAMVWEYESGRLRFSPLRFVDNVKLCEKKRQGEKP